MGGLDRFAMGERGFLGEICLGSLERTRELGVGKGVLPFPLAAASSRAQQNWIWASNWSSIGHEQEKGNDVNENYLLRADSSIWVE
ncbi:hypothetical protein CJ030_MR4G012560 [Morella rubra]|uniref:Uncharacterized protein n=1 Tax=Morella rubra TaxID=262757 RepID=A0A6A1VQT0_9ROSI|nr:hypothetical protein CJ030_MR4G012560 [Morella rubra]